jgi:acylphosphatase
MKIYHIYISGFVQGVGFRWYTKDIAKQLGIKGYVKNLSDGRVEIIAQGNEDSLKNFIFELKKGQLGENISNIETIEEFFFSKFTDFTIAF